MNSFIDKKWLRLFIKNKFNYWSEMNPFIDQKCIHLLIKNESNYWSKMYPFIFIYAIFQVPGNSIYFHIWNFPGPWENPLWKLLKPKKLIKPAMMSDPPRGLQHRIVRPTAMGGGYAWSWPEGTLMTRKVASEWAFCSLFRLVFENQHSP